MKKLLLLLLISQCSFALDLPLLDVEKKLQRGDVQALYDLVPFFDSKDTLVGCDFYGPFGIRRARMTMGDRVRDIVGKNTMLPLDHIRTRKQYVALLKKSMPRLIYEPESRFYYLPQQNDDDHQVVFTPVFKHSFIDKSRWRVIWKMTHCGSRKILSSYWCMR